MWIRVGALDCSSDCMSVLTARNSTPSTCAAIIRSTALTPAPPTPTTRSTGSCLSGDDGWWIGSWSSSGWAARCEGPRSRMFSGMSVAKTERRRSSGVGTPS
jgi:hypothetical protein